MENNETFDLINANPFFADFTEEEKQSIAEFGNRIIHYEEDCFIIRQGTAGQALFILLEGEVIITKNEAPKAELNRLLQGALFGEMSMSKKTPRSTNVISKTKVSVLKLDSAMFDGLDPKASSKLNFHLMKMLIDRLDDMNHKMADFKVKLERFVDAYEYISKEINSNPAIQEKVKIVQELWSNYFKILRR